MYADSESANRSEFVEDPRGEDPDDSTLMRSLREDIATVLRSLTNREADIIKHRFGLEGRRPLSLKEIGLRYHLTKERIRQIEKKALRQLRHPSRAPVPGSVRSVVGVRSVVVTAGGHHLDAGSNVRPHVRHPSRAQYLEAYVA